MATSGQVHRLYKGSYRFQSIGVTKDWRPPLGSLRKRLASPFPINRRHQGLATKEQRVPLVPCQVPCFQSIGVTKDWRRRGVPGAVLQNSLRQFPINRRHQGLATAVELTPGVGVLAFPINRRHQGLATRKLVNPGRVGQDGSFQSIGVTKDWRREPCRC